MTSPRKSHQLNSDKSQQSKTKKKSRKKEVSPITFQKRPRGRGPQRSKQLPKMEYPVATRKGRLSDNTFQGVETRVKPSTMKHFDLITQKAPKRLGTPREQRGCMRSEGTKWRERKVEHEKLTRDRNVGRSDLWRKIIKLHAASILAHVNEGKGSLGEIGGWCGDGKTEVGVCGNCRGRFGWVGGGAALGRKGRRTRDGGWTGWVLKDGGRNMRSIVIVWEGKILWLGHDQRGTCKGA